MVPLTTSTYINWLLALIGILGLGLRRVRLKLMLH